jgi:hypothetical protein
MEHRNTASKNTFVHKYASIAHSNTKNAKFIFEFASHEACSRISASLIMYAKHIAFKIFMLYLKYIFGTINHCYSVVFYILISECVRIIDAIIVGSLSVTTVY